MDGLRRALRRRPARVLAAPRRLGRAAALTLLLAAAGPAAAGPAPTEVVEAIDAALIEAMENAESLGYRGRYERLAPVMRRHFDFPLMARVAVGRHWSSLSEPQRRMLVERFAEVSIATFAARFDGYSGERFRVDGQRPGLRGAVLVENVLVKTDGEEIAINYLLRDDAGRWQVVDVYLDAKYSELAMKRSEYSSVMQRKGFDGLIASLDKEIAQLASGSGGA